VIAITRQHRADGMRLPTSSGAIVMAGGIFGAAALQRLPFAAALTGPLAALLGVAWLGIAGLLVRDAARDGLAAHTEPLLGSFGIGTWVAASAVEARMAMLAAPGEPWLWQGLFAAAIVLWLWFAPQAVGNLLRVARSRSADVRPTGIILLATVSTQAAALSLLRLFPASAGARGAAIALMAVGAAGYIAGALLVVRRYVSDPAWRLDRHWDNTNCILHGALSITGLTAAVGHTLPPLALAWLWAATLAIFVVVEAIELARLVARCRRLGWRQALLVYDTSQWARNFTFGMFYAFTVALLAQLPASAPFPIGKIAARVAACGPYVVLLLLVGELALMVWWVGAQLADGAFRTAASSRRED
jgi:hypothetical protein